MTPLTALAVDALIFVGLAWTTWRALGRSIPIAVIPIFRALVKRRAQADTGNRQTA